MSRRPINVELRGLQTPRERIWQAILKLSPEGEATKFDKNTVQDHCNPMVNWTQVDDYLDELAKAGYLKRVGGTGVSKGVKGVPIEYSLVKRQGEAPRVRRQGGQSTQGAGVEAMWRAMKVLPVFDYKDIARAASMGTLQVKDATAKHYVASLGRAGYLTLVKASKPGVPAKHKLGKNTGPHAPAITRTRVVFDRNTGEFVQLQSAQEVCDGIDD